MRSRPQSPGESGANLSWGIELQLQLFEEVVFGPHVSWVGAPGKEEAWERVLGPWSAGTRRLRRRPLRPTPELRCGSGGRPSAKNNFSGIY